MCGMQVGLHVTSVSSPVGAAHPRPNGRIQPLAARAHQAVSAQHHDVLVTKSRLVTSCTCQAAAPECTSGTFGVTSWSATGRQEAAQIEQWVGAAAGRGGGLEVLRGRVRPPPALHCISARAGNNQH